ncbi:S8 family serine peptidase [Promicromonospora vindobonensis]|uniref:S8 family serine peptidase n=1 Tax=Promicromonospora vindobonensis TaxID=195748 RepID=A0ABW5W4B3_9MICO
MPESELRVRDHAGAWCRVQDLDPARVSSRRQGRLMPTRYVADRLIVRAVDDVESDAVVGMVRERAAARGLELEETAFEEAASRADASNSPGPRPGMAFRVSAGEQSTTDRDVWDLLDEVADAVDGEDRRRVSLDHVLTGHGRWQGHGRPVGREPAVFLGPAPRRTLATGGSPLTASDGTARPVVAVLDSGIGTHPWFDESTSVVLRGATLDGEPVGTGAEDEPLYDAEVRGRRRDDVAYLDAYAGHGTFIAGVVHQVCPDAAIMPVRIFGGDGRVREWDLARTLEKLLEFHLRGVAGADGYWPVDVAVLSGGFYAERPEDDEDYDGVLRGRLRDLRRVGVLVVVSAGNDGSARPMFPAAWAPRVRRTPEGAVALSDSDLRPDYTPLLPVTGDNPDGTLADFSNDGPWVIAARPGARVLSSMPTTFDGAEVPRQSGDGLRRTVDPDNFSSGFGLWSGTSFAAPALAGELAKALLHGRVADVSDASLSDFSSRVAAAWDAVTRVSDLYTVSPASA